MIDTLQYTLRIKTKCDPTPMDDIVHNSIMRIVKDTLFSNYRPYEEHILLQKPRVEDDDLKALTLDTTKDVLSSFGYDSDDESHTGSTSMMTMEWGRRKPRTHVTYK